VHARDNNDHGDDAYVILADDAGQNPAVAAAD